MDIRRKEECQAPAKKIGNLYTGTIFLKLNGELRTLGIVSDTDPGDRGPGSVDYVLETGARGSESDCAAGGDKVIVLDIVEDVGRNPLRTLLNWAAQYGG